MSTSGSISSITVNGIEYPIKDYVKTEKEKLATKDEAELIGFTTDLIIEDLKTGRKVKAKVLIIATEYMEPA